MTRKLAVVFIMTLSALLHAQAPGRNYTLSFSEDFAGDQIDTTKWNFRTDAKALSTQLPANVTVANNRMSITPKKDHIAGMNFTGGGIISKASFRYGYFQVDSQTVADPGWHSSFWLMAGDGKTTFPNIARTEIDDFEIEGNNPDHISMGYLVWNEKRNMASKRCGAAYLPGYNTAAAMHTYGVEWTETTLTYYLDGKSICSQPYPATAGTHDLVNLWLTSIGARLPIDASGKAPAIFAKLRYYVRDYYINAGEPGFAEYGKDWQTGPEPGFSDLPAHASCSADATAVWTPSILESGTYNVQLWQVKNSPSVRNGDAKATILHQGKAEEKTIGTKTAAGWVDLGSYAFDRGVSGSVTLAPGTGCIQANMVKFVRQ